MPWYGWLLSIIGAIGAVVGIAWAWCAWIWPWIKGKPNVEDVKIEVDAINEKVGSINTKLDSMAEYLDGLPQAPKPIRDPFEQARNLEQEHRYRDAVKHYEACFQPETTSSQRAALHILIGNCYYCISELEQALGHYKEAESIVIQNDDKSGLSVALGNMGLIYADKGDMDKAFDCHSRALKIDREIGYRQGEARDLGNMGLIYAARGELDSALECLREVLEIFEQMGAEPLVEQTKSNITVIQKLKEEK